MVTLTPSPFRHLTTYSLLMPASSPSGRDASRDRGFRRQGSSRAYTVPMATRTRDRRSAPR